MRKARDIILIIIGILFIAIIILYARDGRLSFKTLKTDFDEALSLKKERIDERLNYNPINVTDLIARLKDKGLVVGKAEDLGTNTLGAKEGYKINVEGKYIYFYIIDFDNIKDERIVNTKITLDEQNKVYIEGKAYDALVNETAVVAKYSDNPKADIIKKEFESIHGLSYDEMIKERNDNSLNPAVTKVDKILDNFEEALK